MPSGLVPLSHYIHGNGRSRTRTRIPPVPCRQNWLELYDAVKRAPAGRIDIDFPCELLAVSPDGTRVLVQAIGGEGRLDVFAADRSHVAGCRPYQDDPETKNREIASALFLDANTVEVERYGQPMRVVSGRTFLIATGSSPQAPLTSLLLETIVRESGAPENALQVVPCEVDVAEMLVRDDRFATLSFTGSATVGWHLKAISGKKQVILELGGNAAAIVHDDANLAFAADRITAAAFGYAGQVCIKVQRAYLHAPIAEAFTRELVTRARALTPTDPLDPKAVLGPMIDEGNAKRAESWIAEAKASGATVLVGGKRDGAKLEATILQIKGDGRGLKVVDEEVFGPVLTLHTYDSWDEALTLANASRYGLQAGIFTDSHERIRQAFSRLAVGGLIVGDAPSFRVDSMPYGGTRDSGLGREGVRFAIEEMTERKLLVYRF